MRLYIKIGTHPAEWRTTYRRKAPKVGDVFKLRPKQRHQEATRVRCCEVSNLGDTQVYFVECY